MLIQIQPSMHPDFFTPHPFVVAEDGEVEYQVFWKGDPATLLGFQDRLDVKQIDLYVEDWWVAPQQAVNKYPVFARADDTMYVSQVAISEVKVFSDLHPEVLTAKSGDWGLDLVRGSNPRTVIGRVWWDDDRDDGEDPCLRLLIASTETSHHHVDTVAAALRDAGYMLEWRSRDEIADMVDVMALPAIAKLATVADESWKEARLAALDHAHKRHSLALEILRTRWPNAATVEADLSMHLAQEGNPHITRVLDAEGNTIHTVEYSLDVLDQAEQALSTALDFINEVSAGWDGPRSSGRLDGGDGLVHTLKLDSIVTPCPPPPAEEVTRIDRGQMTIDGTAMQIIELVSADVDRLRAFEVAPATSTWTEYPADSRLLDRFLATLRTLPELEAELGVASRALDMVIWKLNDRYSGVPLFTRHQRAGHFLVHPDWISGIREAHGD